MKILLTGGSGQVGFELKRVLSPLGEIIAPDRNELELSDLDSVSDYLNDIKPNLIVNAAAWTAVDAAEDHLAAAFQLNANLPERLAEYANQHGILMIHYSSDYVYDGSGSEPRSELSDVGPLSVYGESKLEGDLAVIKSGADHLIFRTSWVYSARGNNFMKTMLKLAADREALSIVADQVGSPTPARLIAQVTAIAIQTYHSAQTEEGKPSGVYHLVSDGYVSWYEFAQEIFNQAKRSGCELTIKEVNAIATEAYPTPAQRPLNSRLQIDAIQTALNIKMPSWQSQLKLTLDEFLEYTSTGKA